MWKLIGPLQIPFALNKLNEHEKHYYNGFYEKEEKEYIDLLTYQRETKSAHRMPDARGAPSTGRGSNASSRHLAGCPSARTQGPGGTAAGSRGRP